MKQIYEHNEGLIELAYKQGVLPYREILIFADYQSIRNF